MTVYLYLSLIPEALIVSMLPPAQFGEYYAVGAYKKKRGQAMFVELDPDFRHPFFRIDEGIARCVPHDDGTPKRSVYVSTYRVLEHVPLEAMGKLYLVTNYGEVLGLERSEYKHADDEKLHLYQEIAPVNPLIVSTLNPLEFFELITNPSSMIRLPALAFVELRLDDLARDPEHGAIGDLAYSFIRPLRVSLIDVQRKDTTPTKLVNLTQSPDFPYRDIKNGIFVGNTEELGYYAMPSREQLQGEHYRWWRTANL
jgi:hypothetical protein